MQEKIVKTSKGYNAIWESGGGMTNTGFAIIVCGESGEKLEPIYIKRKGNLSCSEHALFLLKDGVIVIHITRKKNHDALMLEDEIQNLYDVKIYEYENGDFIEVERLPCYEEAIKAGKEKTKHYHCRTPYYFLNKEESCDNQNLSHANNS